MFSYPLLTVVSTQVLAVLFDPIQHIKPMVNIALILILSLRNRLLLLIFDDILVYTQSIGQKFN